MKKNDSSGGGFSPKSTILFFISAVFLLFVATPTLAIQSLDITLASQQPSEAAPGQLVELVFQLENKGDEEVRNLRVEFVNEFPFEVVQGLNIRNFTRVPFLAENKPLLVRYTVRVDDRAPDGDVPFTVRLKADGINAEREFEINVQSVGATLNIVSVMSDPEQILPGQDGKLHILIQNTASVTLRDIAVKLGLSGEEIPLAPVDSATQKRIALLKPGESQTVTYNIKARAEAKPDFYKIPINITYLDNLNNLFSVSDTLSVVIGSEPEISAYLDSSQLVQGQKTGVVSVRIVNKGFTDVKFLSISLPDTEQFDVLSGKDIYVGNLDSDDFETADFTVELKDTNAMVVDVPITITFKDTVNEAYNEQATLNARVAPSERSAMSWVVPLVIVVVVVGLVVFFVRRKPRKGRDD